MPADSGGETALFVVLTPRRAFLYSLMLPGIGQSRLDRGTSGALFASVELAAVAMVRRSVADLQEVRRYRIDSLPALARTPIASLSARSPQLLSNLATFERGSAMAVVNHYNVQPVFDVYANVEHSDLGSVARGVARVVAEMESALPRGIFLEVRGQVETMQSSFTGLGLGLIFAVILVYLLMVVNFQSWLDPFIIMMALPGALAGILWMLLVTQTTISVPALMGAIMTIGVAAANSILVVTFANDRWTGPWKAADASPGAP